MNWVRSVVIAAAIVWCVGPRLLAQDIDAKRAAEKTAQWIRSTVVETGGMSVWPGTPGDSSTVGTSIYSGAAGVVLFFLESHHATGDPESLADACRGADFLLSAIDREEQLGFYEGLAGVGFALNEAYKSSGKKEYQDGARRCVERIKERAQRVGSGVEWGDTTDIIAGSAGIGLFLLYAARELEDEGAQLLARDAGDRLIELGAKENAGLKWRMDPRFERLMPNFSHGTAGVAYFLATLHLETKDPRFLDAALAGGRYLQAIADSNDGGCLIFHHEPNGEDLFYLGWCHGPVGTARLFFRLYEATRDEAWLTWVERSAHSILRSGIPEKQTPGFWNNVGQCCGSAGVAEFFLDLHRQTGEVRYREFSQRVTSDLLRRATDDAAGMRWVQAEHRVKPELLIAQTGYMQGAAGIGMWLLHWDESTRGQSQRVVFPDSPW